MANTTKTPEVLADETYEQRQDREDAARHEAEEALAQDPSVIAAAIADHNAEMAEQEGLETMTTTTETRITLSCDRCGTRIPWDRADLEYHLRRLDGGEHAACACDDDCAAECSPWDRERLAALIAQVSP